MSATRSKPKTKARGRRKPPPKPPSRQQLLERDPWHFDREDPIFAAICKVYIEHPSLVYDHWEIWVGMHPTCPLDEDMLQAGGYKKPVPYHDWLWPMGKLHTEGGGGEIERQANSIMAMMHGIDYMDLVRIDGSYTRRRTDSKPLPKRVMKASEALLALFRRRYEQVVEGLASPRWRGQKPRKPRRSFERIMRDCGFNKRLLDLLDREVERQCIRAAMAAAKQERPTPTPRRKKCRDTTGRSRSSTSRKQAGSSRGRSRATSPAPRSTSRGSGGRSSSRSAPKAGSRSRSARTRSTAASSRRSTKATSSRRAGGANAATERTGTATRGRARVNTTRSAAAPRSPSRR